MTKVTTTSSGKLTRAAASLTVALSTFACGAEGERGPKGVDGKDGAVGMHDHQRASSFEPSLSLVFPNEGILDRELEVSISGDGTKFQPHTKPDFGDGIEVVDTITSTTSLIIAKLRISKDAELGPRTIRVGDLVAKNAFRVIPAIDVTSEKGKAEVEQGGMAHVWIDNNDARAFDPTSFYLDPGGFIDLGTRASGPRYAASIILAPPLIQPGSSRISVANLDSNGKPRISFMSASDAVSVKARPAVPLDTGKTYEMSFTTPTETKLFKLSSPENAAFIVDYVITAESDGKAFPVALAFGTGGSKDDLLGQTSPIMQRAGNKKASPFPSFFRITIPLDVRPTPVDHYLVLAELDGHGSTRATITATRAPALVSYESSFAHGVDTPQLVGEVSSISGQIISASLGGKDEIDAYKFLVEPDALLQISATSDVDLEILLTKDASTLEDSPTSPAAERQVLAHIQPGKGHADQYTLTSPTYATEVYAVVKRDARAAATSGKYTLGLRKLP